MTDYEFDWDDSKAAANLQKHSVEFAEAMTVLADPLSLTRFDDEHSEDEERWITLGMSIKSRLLVVVHTFVETGPNAALIRVISARLATRNERVQYEDN